MEMTKEEFFAVMNNHQLKRMEWMEEWIRSTGLEQKSSIEMRELKDGWFSTIKVYEDDSKHMEKKLDRYLSMANTQRDSLNKAAGLDPA